MWHGSILVIKGIIVEKIKKEYWKYTEVVSVTSSIGILTFPIRNFFGEAVEETILAADLLNCY